ncbi:MAG: biotin--[acetyl-CoA-carboxylase] ligase [Chloroflexi bacterium]|nr:biotin--[acetyl-CoA-carboxylase] ligase [Chloroflexota bacterium]
MTFSDMSVEAVRQGLATRIVGQRLLYCPQVTSTMDVARQEAAAGAPEGTVVLAEEQTAGRGRFQRRWVSPPGANLYFSVLLYPSLEELHRLNMAATLAVVRAVQVTTGLYPSIKWPNDIRLGGRKLCGILIESSLEGSAVRYAIVGIGVNVNLDTSQHPEIASIATSLSKERGGPVSRQVVLRAILEEMDSLYCSLKGGESAREEWVLHLETLGKWVQVRWGEHVEEGLAHDVDLEGNLVLERRDKSRITVAAGEVTLQA